MINGLIRGLAVLVAIAMTGADSAGAVGFQEVTAAASDGRPIAVAIWYPSDESPTSQKLGLFEQSVARDAAPARSGLPLIVISHGSGGGSDSHYDTALALAASGFVVAAPMHPGDNWRDHADSFTLRNLVERPRQIKAVIDYMLASWQWRDRLDPSRVRLFAHSIGGFAGIVALGGTPELERIVSFCREHSDLWECKRARARSIADAPPPDQMPAPEWTRESRITAAVLAVPGLGYAFASATLSDVKTSIQLWQGAEDRITSPQWNSDAIKAALPEPPEAHLVPSAGHFAFVAPCSEALAARASEVCRDPPGFDRAAFHQDFNRTVAAFFISHLTVP